MPRDTPPAVREDDVAIEIDAKKGRWPFVKAIRGERGRLALVIDQNEGGQVIGEGRGVGIIVISRKKAKRLREFLERTE